MAKLKVFTKEWCDAWADKVRASEEFTKFNKGWEGDISGIIFADPDRNVPEEQYLYMDLHDGECRDISMIDKEKAENAKFVMSGDYVRWKQVGMGELDAVKAMMQGKLKLKGNLPYVVKYVKGVQEMIKRLIEVETEYPDD